MQTVKQCLLLLAAFTNASQGADSIDLRTLMPRNAIHVAYEEHLERRVQKLSYTKREAYPSIAVKDTFYGLSNHGWRMCRTSNLDWLRYSDATRDPEVIVYSNWQVLTKGTELIHLVAYFELVSGNKPQGEQLQRIAITYANFDDHAQLSNEISRLDVKCGA